tara:strand:- start:5223 stop:5558 length:336 start_codon:yes stop_codon:yes gene_type:complete
MCISNLAIHHANRLSGQSSIAAACLERLDIKRPLKTAPGFFIKTIRPKNYTPAKYMDINGNRVKRNVLINQYGLSGRQVLNIFNRTGNDHVEAHRQLEISSRNYKRRVESK